MPEVIVQGYVDKDVLLNECMKDKHGVIHENFPAIQLYINGHYRIFSIENNIARFFIDRVNLDNPGGLFKFAGHFEDEFDEDGDTISNLVVLDYIIEEVKVNG